MFRIYDGRDYFYQWDIDRKIIVEDETITEVHFCNRTDDCSLICEVYSEGNLRVANVPNILLQDNWRINVYAYDGSCTKHATKFEVKSRTKPSDYMYTETEIKTFSKLENRMDELEANVSVEGIAKAVEDYLIANPVEAGATKEEKEQIEQNKEDIEVLQAQSARYALKSEIPSVKGLATKDYVDNAISGIEIPDVSGYQTEAQVIALINANMPASGDEVSY